MLASLSSKPLNPDAQSWFPDTKNTSSKDLTKAQKLPCPLPNEIYGSIPSHVPSATVIFPFPQPPPLQVHPPIAVFQASPLPHEGSLHYTVIQHECLPFGLLMEKKSHDMKMEMPLKDSKSVQDILGNPELRPKFFRKVVPPRLRMRDYCKEELQGRKMQPTKVRMPKKSNDGVAATEFVPSVSLPEEERPDCEKTTVMLKNIPNQYRRDSLMEFLNMKCIELRLAYDFLYLPMDFIKGANLGFAFVNFTTASAALKIKSALEGYKWGEFYIPNGKFTSGKILEITWAKIQGKDALIKHFENSRFTCDSIQYLPVVIYPPSNGSSISSLITVGQLLGFKKSSKTARKITKPAILSIPQ